CLTALCCRYSFIMLHLFNQESLVEGSEVTQTPTILWGLKDSDAQMNCSHTEGAYYNQMYWYRQRPGEGMKEVVYTSSFRIADYGAFSEDKYPTDKTVAESGSFTVKKLETGDSGMYFCAVSQHSDTDNKHSCTKTPVFQ
uniref:Ig-like domain-containing protein n=1 Tax=Hucho hucho TaxID=62062 RepID=A0A4W5LL32_9TELE